MHSLISECTHKQPNAKNCFVCGRDNQSGLQLSFYDDDKDTVISRFTLDSRFEGYPQIAHGGVLASVLDEVVGRVAMVGDHHRFMMTMVMNVQYRNPAPIATELTAVGKRVKLRGKICKAEGKIYLPDGTIACEAALSLMDMPAELKNDERVDQLDWGVDPD